MIASTRRGLTLFESARHDVLRDLAVTSLGVAVELALVAGAVGIASIVPTPAVRESPLRPVFIAPKQEKPQQATREQLHYVGLLGQQTAPDDASTRNAQSSHDPAKPAMSPSPSAASTEQIAVEPQRPLSEIEVDSLAERDPSSEGPNYPPELLAKQIEGLVRARFVVDTTGRADPISFTVLLSTDSLFTLAVRTALPRMKFRPALLRGRVVPQLVEQDFAFRITKPVAPA